MIVDGFVFKTNNFGDCRVVKYGGCFSVIVEFLDTGYQCVTSSGQIKNGTVRDRTVPTICGVGYLGDAVPHDKVAYTTWINMIKRCYDPKVHEIRKTYIGCYVCDEWLNYSNFYWWYKAHFSEGLELDKDKKFYGNRVYSPDTCSFISQTENMQIAFSKKYELTKRSGEVVQVENLTLFCRENGLTRSGIARLMSGERKSHKCWVSAKKLTQ